MVDSDGWIIISVNVSISSGISTLMISDVDQRRGVDATHGPFIGVGINRAPRNEVDVGSTVIGDVSEVHGGTYRDGLAMGWL